MKNLKKVIILIAIMSVGQINATEPPIYPQPPIDTLAIDTYFDITVADPYRPLEDDRSEATATWVKLENRLTRNYLDAIPYKNKIKERLTELNNYPKYGLPWIAEDNMYYFFENDGLKNQSVLFRCKKLGDKAELFLDPNTLSKDGTVALTGLNMSPNGKYTAYTISRSGSDWTEIYLIDTKTKQLLNDHIEWAKFTNAEWDNESKGFYYSAYSKPIKGHEFSNVNIGHNIYYHRIGTSQDEDLLIYSNQDEPLRFHAAWMPEKCDYLFVSGSGQGDGNSLMMRKANDNKARWISIETTQNYQMISVAVINDTLYLRTNMNAPTGKLVAISLTNPTKENWREIIPASEKVISGVYRTDKDKFVVLYQKDAKSEAMITSLAGCKITDIELPGYGSLSLSATYRSPQIIYSFSSFNTPPTQYLYDVNTKQGSLYRKTDLLNFNSENYVVEQVFFESFDGTKIPMFLTYKKGLKRNGNNPVYLYGYGGFNISLTPNFNANRLEWLENGGIYVQVNLRGGSEYGEDWHQAGTRMNKLNVFNDFISATEYMINQGWTTPEKIVIEGGSNGGLLVGAVTNMRPELFKVAIPRVGVMDMMRYHLFTIGWNWAPDYGTSSDTREMANYLLQYSPMHNIKNDGTKYPAILVTTADHDDRVVPAHSFKYTATLQHSNTGDAVKLIRVDTNAGHGAGKPIGKVIDEWTDIYSFIYKNLGIKR